MADTTTDHSAASGSISRVGDAVTLKPRPQDTYFTLTLGGTWVGTVLVVGTQTKASTTVNLGRFEQAGTYPIPLKWSAPTDSIAVEAEAWADGTADVTIEGKPFVPPTAPFEGPATVGQQGYKAPPRPAA
jgi:hypothetical protein